MRGGGGVTYFIEVGNQPLTSIGQNIHREKNFGEKLTPVKEGDEKNAAQTRGKLDHVDQKGIGPILLGGMAKLWN